METSELVHSVSSLCSAPPDHAFAYLTDPHRLGEWSLGCWETRAADGVVRGTSLFDGAETLVRMIPVPEHRIVDFAVGDDPARLTRRISARVVPGEDVGGDPESSLVVLSAWRTRSMDDERWRRLVVAHEAEILLLRHGIERSAA
jgi:hypothetical protein